MRVWITKYALTEGIIEAEAQTWVGTESIIELIRPDGSISSIYYHGKGKEWHESLENAIKKFDNMRSKKLLSLHKQVHKLMDMKPKVVKYS